MIQKPLSEIDLDVLQGLIADEVREGKTIDYKRDLSVDTGDQKKEFLADLSSFANTASGDLIIGMEEQEGVPVAIPGIILPDVDREIQRLHSIIQEGVEPRIPSVEIQPVSVGDEKWVLVVRIGKSWISPHRASYRGHGHFYARNSAGKYRLDVGELRTAFTLAEGTAEKIRNFRIDRLARIIGGETPVPIREGVKIALHLIPLAAFTSGNFIEMPLDHDRRADFAPLSGSISDWRNNLDGFVCYSGNPPRPHRAYLQLFRTGVVETVEISVYGEGNIINGPGYEVEIVQSVKRYLKQLQILGIGMPVYIFLSVLDASGAVLRLPESWHFRRGGEYGHQADRNEFILPEAVIEDYDTDIPVALKPQFDMIWNAFGYDGSINFDAEGNWIGENRRN
ncbi:MAG: ATP-binding protein [bacterium]|nr:ATP-binding protein [bacterium]